MALQPLGNYVFFLAQFQTFGYVVVYFAFLFYRYRCGVPTAAISMSLCLCVVRLPLVEFPGKLVCCRNGSVTKEMLDAPDKRLFLLIGGLEAVSQLLGFIGASKLPGASCHQPALADVYTVTPQVSKSRERVYGLVMLVKEEWDLWAC